MKLETAIVTEHSIQTGGYRLLVLRAPEVASRVQPGQFLHVRVPRLEASVLRRPFSIYRAEAGHVAVLYKVVGHGTEVMSAVDVGDAVSLMGPLGNGYPVELPPGAEVALIAGGYGVAPLSLLASRLPVTGTVFAGARTAEDILCVEDFERLEWRVEVTTEDGSLGERGLVTGPLDRWLAARPGKPVVLFACGPQGLMKAVGERAVAGGVTAWLSLDKNMCCGAGACLTCVQRVREADGTTRWKRVCKDGPVFEAGELVWEEEA